MNPTATQTNHPGFTLVEFLVSFTLVTLLITGTVQITIHTLFIKRNADSFPPVLTSGKETLTST
ncbi:hypothetical protein ES703_106449 [subsurface metagenome]